MSGAAGLVLAALLGTAARAQEEPQELPPNAPARCPYCRGEAELMAASGVVSHGGFGFARTDTAGMDALFPDTVILWVETPHLELGLALDEYRVPREERRKLQAELDDLRRVLPDVPAKARVLDPWLRTHLFARRVERIYARFVEIMHIDESLFPDGATPWVIGTPYHGEGPYLGMKSKFEVLVLPDETRLLRFLQGQFGLAVRQSQRWNVQETQSLTVAMHLMEEGLREDPYLHGHIAFNLAINFLNGYKHFAYDTPVWLTEGLAHYMQREIDPRLNSFDSTEGFFSPTSWRVDWVTLVKRMIQEGKAPTMAQLVPKTSYSQLEVLDHYAIWSMTAFLVEEHGEGYACLNDRLHGIKSPEGFADASDMRGRQRDAFRDCLGMSYFDFDEAWRAWALGLDWDSWSRRREAKRGAAGGDGK